MEHGLELRLDPSVDEVGAVDPKALVKRTLEDILEHGNPMEKMTAAGSLLRVDAERLQDRIERVGLRIRIHGHPRFAKEYPDKPRVALPTPTDLTMPFSEVVRTRRSTKMFSGDAVTLQELSDVLWHCYGVTLAGKLRTREHDFYPFRAAPTSGGLSGNELYVLAVNVNGLEEGLYHFNGPRHELDVLSKSAVEVVVPRVWLQPETLRHAAFFIMLTADLRRGAWKYDSRYLHTVLLDTGGILGYSMLAATALGLHANPLTAFSAENLAKLLKIDGVHEIPAVTAVFGKPGRSNFYFPPPAEG